MYKVTVEKIDVDTIEEETLIKKLKDNKSVIDCYHCSENKIDFYIDISNAERALREAARLYPSCRNGK